MQAAASILVTKKQTICNWGCTYKLRFFALLVDGVKDAVVRGSWRQVASKELMLKQCVVWYSDVLFGKKIECKQSIIPHYVSFQIITVSYKLQCKVDIAQNAGKIFFFLKKKYRENTSFSAIRQLLMEVQISWGLLLILILLTHNKLPFHLCM